MLDIIVTHYDEPWEVGKPLFDMLGMQHGVDFNDFRVIFVNDGPEHAIDESYFAGYPYHTDVITIPHGGVSAARNAGLDAATAEWINFCDFDDNYCSIYSLRDVISLFPAPNYDMLWAGMVTEDFTDGQDILYMTPRESVFVFLHGKYYRRSFIVDNHIRFDTDIHYNEDSEFNALLIAIMDYHRIGEIKSKFPVYAWSRRQGSVTNREGAVDPANHGHFRRNLKVCRYYLDNLPLRRVQDMVTRAVYDTYYMCESLPELSDTMRNTLIAELRDFMIGEGYEVHYVRPNDEILDQIRYISKMDRTQPFLDIPDDYETVTEWFHRVLHGEESRKTGGSRNVKAKKERV